MTLLLLSQVPPNKTDQVQPIDRGLGRHIKIYMGQEEDAWLEEDDNLQKWENNELSASDRRILIAQWYCKAYKRALEGEAKRKYFEHAGALLTADGSGDDLIKLEGVPRGETFTWEDDPLDEAPPEEGEGTRTEYEPEPDDVCPLREDTTAREVDEDDDDDEQLLDDDDDPDEGDAPPAPKLAPSGFKMASEPPPAEQLAFSKEPSAADALLGKSILYNWPVIGWCVGTITERNCDARSFKMIDQERVKVNFFVHYDIDDDTIKTVLRLDEYDGDEEGSWVLLEADVQEVNAAAAGAGEVAEAAAAAGAGEAAG